uniref:DNA primase n=1 Tax=Heterorhabditis bacteriophora TaxID=37862 RepID=A0A1I7XUQ4_HETBA
MDFMPSFVIDTSTPESLERDFYAWLNMEGTPCYETQSLPCLSLPPLKTTNTDGIYREHKEVI